MPHALRSEAKHKKEKIHPPYPPSKRPHSRTSKSALRSNQKEH